MSKELLDIVNQYESIYKAKANEKLDIDNEVISIAIRRMEESYFKEQLDCLIKHTSSVMTDGDVIMSAIIFESLKVMCFFDSTELGRHEIDALCSNMNKRIKSLEQKKTVLKLKNEDTALTQQMIEDFEAEIKRLESIRPKAKRVEISDDSIKEKVKDKPKKKAKKDAPKPIKQSKDKVKVPKPVAKPKAKPVSEECVETTEEQKREDNSSEDIKDEVVGLVERLEELREVYAVDAKSAKEIDAEINKLQPAQAKKSKISRLFVLELLDVRNELVDRATFSDLINATNEYENCGSIHKRLILREKDEEIVLIET